MIPPDTPLLAGSPTVWIQSPDESYMPQVAMTLRTDRTVAADSTRSPVRGLTPPFASVAAIVASARASTSTEHWAKYRSSAASGSSASAPDARRRWAIARLRWPVSRSESKTTGSTASGRPAAAANSATIRSSAGTPSAGATRDAAAIAPALTIALSGTPLPGASVIALNASPVGSTPIRRRTVGSPRSSRTSPYVNGFEIDWIVNGTRLSPAW